MKLNLTMAAQERERAAKRKLNGFLADALRVGCTRGFKYFQMYMRGREELICSVKNELPLPSGPPSSGSQFVFNSSSGFVSAHLPIDQPSGYGFMDIGLPPASPSDHETATEIHDERSTVFLVAGYSRYSCPYVWVRSNHERLIKGSQDGATRYSKDCPLRLKSTSAWHDKDIKVWDILAELVKLCTFPSPRNPFTVDMDYFDALPLPERITASGAMSHLLQTILKHGADNWYNGPVSEDLREITKRHFIDFQTFLKQRQEGVQGQSRNT